MKFIISIVNREDAPALVGVLVANGYGIATFNATGGFLCKEYAMLFVGVEDEQVEEAARLIREHCCTRVQPVSSLPPVMESGESYVLDTEKAEIGGAVIFVLDVVRFFKA